VKFRRKTALIAPAVVIAMTAAACGGSNDSGGGGGGGDSDTRKGGTVVYGFEGETPVNLSGLIAAGNSTSTGYLMVGVIASPYNIEPDFQYKVNKDMVVGEPTSTESGGKQVVVYKINPNAKWSDGQPIGAKDFKYSWEAQRSSEPSKGGCAALLSTTGYDQIEAVEGSDNDKTVTVTYSKPYADWKSSFTQQQLLPAHIMDKGNPKANCDIITKGWPTKDGVPVASGPWQVEAKNVDIGKKTITLTPNPNYYGEKPKLDRMVFQNIGNDPGTTVKALKSGEIGIIYPQPQLDLVKQVKDLEPNITSKVSFGLSFEHMDFNTRNPLLAQLPVRQAIALAIDRPALVSATVGAFDNRAKPMNNRIFVNNQVDQYKDNSGGKYDKANVAGAKKLLEDAGFTLGSDGIYAKGGQKLAFKMMTTVNNPLRANTIDVISQQVKAAGIKIEPFLNPDIFEGKEKPTSLEGGQFDIALFAWVSGAAWSSNKSIYQSVVGDQQFQNYTHGNDPKVDSLMNQAVVETDQTKAADLWNQVDTQLWADMFTLPLYQKPTFLAYTSNLTGIDDNASLYGPLWNANTFALKK
jgi:peptide/nickel transport system substrate-binding protein